MAESSDFLPDFINRLHEAQEKRASRSSASPELPEFDIPKNALDNDASNTNNDINLLVTRSTSASFRIGTGASIFTEALIPAILSARSEIILVTCYWATSKSLTALSAALASVAAHRQRINHARQANGQQPLPRLRVRMCLSSRGLMQKLLHTASRNGYVYPPSSWATVLGLPAPDVLERGGLDLHVKSLFFLPFSIMHPKFVIVDRERAFLPSCNISWEPWLEACVDVRGEAVRGLMEFYARTWENDLDLRQRLPVLDDADIKELSQDVPPQITIACAAHASFSLPASSDPIPTVVLPSSHHRNPQFRPFPWQSHPPAPETPLNTATLQLIEQARDNIYMQTPNLATWPIMLALLDALARGVSVTVVTNDNMMPVEQIITAGTTGARCIAGFLAKYNALSATGRSHQRDDLDRMESQPPRVGNLHISYFRPRQGVVNNGEKDLELRAGDVEEPVQSHVKLTVFDGRWTLLGSGNMDRASLFTSQELGILFDDLTFAQGVRSSAGVALEGRLDTHFDSTSQ